MDEQSQLINKEEKQKDQQEAKMKKLGEKHQNEEQMIQKLLDELQDKKQQYVFVKFEQGWATLLIYCDVPGSPCLSKKRSVSF